MKNKLIYVIAILGIALLSCKKEEVEPVMNTEETIVSEPIVVVVEEITDTCTTVIEDTVVVNPPSIPSILDTWDYFKVETINSSGTTSNTILITGGSITISYTQIQISTPTNTENYSITWNNDTTEFTMIPGYTDRRVIWDEVDQVYTLKPINMATGTSNSIYYIR